MFDYNAILNREHIKNDIIEKLDFFENNKSLKTIKRGFYISGTNGIGKTEFVKNILRQLNYDVLHYSACDVRNKGVIESLTKENMSDKNVASMFHKKKKKIAIIMDEIDGFNSGDKGGISSLINIIRPKKTKKQQIEPISNNPIFCISTNEIDKKTKELIKVCFSYELHKPTLDQMKKIVSTLFINLIEVHQNLVIEHSQFDFKKLHSLQKIYSKDSSALVDMLTQGIFTKKSVIEISKDIVKTIYSNYIPIEKHNVYINENDRTIVALLWHENVCDVIKCNDIKFKLLFYKQILENLCYGDYVDRITFQKQIWQFNELSSFIKVMYNNFLMHNNSESMVIKCSQDIRFTKVLTKYSTEFNNYVFFQSISNNMRLDKKDMISLFNYIRINTAYESNVTNSFDIKELDIQRIYRYIDNHRALVDSP